MRGKHAAHVLAFARVGEAQRAVVVVPRLAASLLGTTAHPLIPAQNWDDTRVLLPFALRTANCTGLFAQDAVTTSNELWLSTALKAFPVNLFIEQTETSGASR